MAQTSLVNDTFAYADQTAFEAVWTKIGGGTPPGSLGVIGGTLSSDFAVSPPFSVKNVSPAATVPPENSTSAFSQRNQRTFSETGTITPTLGVRYSFDFYDVAPTAEPYRQYSDLQDSTNATATNQLISLGLNHNQSGTQSGGQFYMARILGYTVPTTPDPEGGPAESVGGASVFFKLNDFSTGVGTGPGARSAGWHNLKVELTTNDGLSTDYNFYVDNVLSETLLNIGTAASIRSYDVLRLGSGVSSTTIAYYDNFVVETFTVGSPPTDDADFDQDGDVDGADFLTWQRGLGGPGAQADGDADGDTMVTGLDLAVWRDQFGPGATPAVGTIPEPASVALAAVAMLTGLAIVRRR